MPKPQMNVSEFIAKWSDATLQERQGSQEHFLDLCHLLDQPTPAADDPHGERYCFERGATKAGGGDGWADVWRRGSFGWEYKGPHKDLNAAFRQLSIYASALENPPYLVVSDMTRIVIHTNWTNTVSEVFELSLEDLREPGNLELLRQVFEGSDKLKPGVSPQELTAKVAVHFGILGRKLQDRGEDPHAVAHFLNRLVFCMFAEDARLLPKELFTRVIRAVEKRPELAAGQLGDLFEKMHRGGFFGADVIRWFNGGLFDDAPVLDLDGDDLKLIGDTAAEHDWSEMDPAIFGTLFEEALKATDRRAALGAHYTGRDKILKIVAPVVVQPLAAEWAATLSAIRELAAQNAATDTERAATVAGAAEMMKHDPAAARASEAGRRKKLAALSRRRTLNYSAAQEQLEAFLTRLANFRILDPACGSGNFLYVALHALKDLELRAMVDTERAIGIPKQTPRVGLDNVRGIEIEPYAAELARVTLWIGDLQWMKRNGFTGWSEPILSTLAQIEKRDALLTEEGGQATWPDADVIIGNPPFVGDKKQGQLFQQNDLQRVRAAYHGLVKPSANLVAYWFYKAGEALKGATVRFGFVATQAIRRGASRSVVQKLLDDGAEIFDAWSNESWQQEGAEVRVSLVSFRRDRTGVSLSLDGSPSTSISADLRADIAQARPSVLAVNKKVAGQGTISGGPFEVPPDMARRMLRAPTNPNGLPNSAVIRPWRNGDDLTDRPADWWIIDFGKGATLDDAALFEAPFQYLKNGWEAAQAARQAAGEKLLREGEPKTAAAWWILQRRRSELLLDLSARPRYLATPRVSKHRFFVWLHPTTVPDTRLVAFRRDDDTFGGILQSKYHEIWSLRFGGNHGVGNDPEYVHTSTFETFPFPANLSPERDASDYAGDPYAQAIAEAFANLDARRQAWLNPPELVRRESEVAAGLPDRLIAVDDAAAKILKTRTMTELYNERPAWLDMAQARLDQAVAVAYGFPVDLQGDAILERLYLLNQERAGSLVTGIALTALSA